MADELLPVPDDLGLGATVRGFIEGQRLFDRYVLQRVLGRGGMGVVWLATDEKLERNVALKFLPELIKLDSAALDELKRETRRSLELTHPHIVRIYDFVDSATAAAISMEYVDGQTLSAWRVAQPNRIFETGQIREWIGQLVEALDYAHRKAKLVHRDLKPANLMINTAGDLKVADFGIARSISDSVSRVTMRAGTSGTLVYMSPQQAMGQKPKVTDDIYSFGSTIYELLTSRPPFYSGDILAQVREVVPPSMTERRADLEIAGEVIPAEWEQTVAACLAKEPAQRPQSMAQAAAQLGLGAIPVVYRAAAASIAPAYAATNIPIARTTNNFNQEDLINIAHKQKLLMWSMLVQSVLTFFRTPVLNLTARTHFINHGGFEAIFSTYGGINLATTLFAIYALNCLGTALRMPSMRFWLISLPVAYVFEAALAFQRSQMPGRNIIDDVLITSIELITSLTFLVAYWVIARRTSKVLKAGGVKVGFIGGQTFFMLVLLVLAFNCVHDIYMYVLRLSFLLPAK